MYKLKERMPPYRKGRIFYEYTGLTYGCLSPEEIAVTEEPDKTPFIGIKKTLLYSVGTCESLPTVKTKWCCELCGKFGIMETPKHLDFWGGYQQLIAEHKKASPECNFESWKVRVSIVDEGKKP